MVLPLLVVPVVSLLTQPPKPEIVATAFGDPPLRREEDKSPELAMRG